MTCQAYLLTLTTTGTASERLINAIKIAFEARQTPECGTPVAQGEGKLWGFPLYRTALDLLFHS